MNRKSRKEIKYILIEAKKRLKQVYGARLKKIILYGSYARGDATKDSDIDLILLLTGAKETGREIRRCSEAFGDLELEYDTLISVLPINESQYNKRRLPVILNAKKDGVVI
jgi:predicted nucleotidyltransferase